MAKPKPKTDDQIAAEFSRRVIHGELQGMPDDQSVTMSASQARAVSRELLRRERAAARWIPVTEALPPSSAAMAQHEVWAYFPEVDRCAVALYYDFDSGRGIWRMIGSPSDWEVTHWAPLLDFPEGTTRKEDR